MAIPCILLADYRGAYLADTSLLTPLNRRSTLLRQLGQIKHKWLIALSINRHGMY